MSRLIINGGNTLRGEITLQGAKNGMLPVLTATLLCKGRSVIHNCPRLRDTDVSMDILRSLGCKCTQQEDTVTVDASDAHGIEVSDALMSRMRSSIIFLGAIAAKNGVAHMGYPGGCELGLRPINLHIESLRKMGMSIKERHGRLYCSAPDGLKGCEINLSIASVGATENIILAASTAKGETVIHNAAMEPEIADLAAFLNKCGAKIYGAGTPTVRIIGVRELNGAEHSVIPDRIAAATYMAAAAVTGGEINIKNISLPHLYPVVPYFEESGCIVRAGGNQLTLSSPGRLKRIGSVCSSEFPGFPTDAMPPFLAMMTLSDGTSVFEENIFSSRYRYIDGLIRMGARVTVKERVAVVEGVGRLTGASVVAPDLRGGAALIVAGLAADGTTEVDGMSHVDRGYEKIEDVLSSLGADIKRETENEQTE